MTSDERLLLILRRLDEIERTLDRMEELRTPTAKVSYAEGQNLGSNTAGRRADTIDCRANR